MQIKWRSLILLALVVLSGCRKNEVIVPGGSTNGQGNGTAGSKGFSMANVLQSNMVVQRDKPFLIWGKAQPAEKVSINVSWNTQTFNATTSNMGTWSVTIPAAGATTLPQTIIGKGEGINTVTLSNILIGDVWICSGQSNMVMPVDAISPFLGVLNYQDEIAAASYPGIRALTVSEDQESAPADAILDAHAWTVCSPATVGQMSAVAYYFARKLNIDLNVPIGIIISAVNGTSCESWTNNDIFKSNPYLAAEYTVGKSTLFNGMINPFASLSIKGFTWYQGENNQHNDPVSDYTLLNSAMIGGWRTVFNQGNLPFYFVQMTPFAEDYNSTNPVGGNPALYDYALFREAQANILNVAGTGMAVTMDVGEAANHHPRDKKPVGERLALLALKNTYAQNVPCYGPRYESFSQSGNTVTINFVAGTASGLNTIDNKPLKQYFFMAGTDHIFRQGMAVINGSNIMVTAAAGTPLPVQAIRYAFTNAPVTNLQNSAALPAEPFRSDQWDN